MQIDSNFVAALAGALGIGGGFGTWLERKRAERRAEAPHIRWDGATIEIANRIDEDIFITEVIANGPARIGDYLFDDGGSIIPDTDTIFRAPFDPGWIVPAKSRARFALSVEAESQRATLSISSSLKTMRCRRFSIRASARP